MYKFLCQNCIFKIKMNLNKFEASKNGVFLFTLRWCSTPSSNNLAEWTRSKTKFTDKQLTKVLNVLNKCDINELRKSGISEQDIGVLKDLSTDNKVHQSLEDFLKYDQIKVCQLENICSTILLSKKASASKKSTIISPPIKKEKIKTAVGLRIGPNYISWSQLELTGSNCNILKWDCQSISDLPLNVNVTEIIKEGINIATEIPDADAYVMEKEVSKPQSNVNSSLLRLLLRQQQLISTIITSLWTRNQLDGSINDNAKTFYTMRSFAPAKLFGLFVGQESVAAKDVVQDLLDKKQVGLNNIETVTINYKLENFYNQTEISQKEEMNKSLLLTLTFFEQAVLQMRR